MTVSESPALCVVAPLVPTTENGYVPVAVPAPTDTVSELPALPPGDGVTEAGLKLHVAPDGRPVHERATAELNPFTLPTVAVPVPLAPWAIVRLAGAADTVKSGGGAVVLTANTRSSRSL